MATNAGRGLGPHNGKPYIRNGRYAFMSDKHSTIVLKLN